MDRRKHISSFPLLDETKIGAEHMKQESSKWQVVNSLNRVQEEEKKKSEKNVIESELSVLLS